MERPAGMKRPFSAMWARHLSAHFHTNFYEMCSPSLKNVNRYRDSRTAIIRTTK